MSYPSLSREEATIEIEGGELALGIRRYTWNYGSYTHQGVEWLGFDEHDRDRSLDTVKGSRQLSFEVWSTISDSRKLIVYLGDPHKNAPWDENLAIPLRYQTNSDDDVWKRWWVGSEKENERVANLRKKYWRAAEATITLYQKREKGRTLLHDSTGRLVSTTIRIGYENEKYERLYKDVLENMEGLMQGDLSSTFQQYVDFDRLRERREETVGLELYKRIEGVFPRYYNTVQQILRDPDVRHEPQMKYHSLSVKEASDFFARRSASDALHRVHDVQSTRMGHIPTRFTSQQIIQKQDTPANRFVAHSLWRVRRAIQQTRDRLEEEKNFQKSFYDESEWRSFLHAHDDAIRQLNGFLDQMNHLISRQPCSSKPKRETTSLSSVLYYDGRYTRLRELTSLIETLLQFVDTSEDAIPFEVQAFQELYQHWVFIHIVEALHEIGFQFVDGEGRRTTPFYKNPIHNDVNCRLIHPNGENFVIEVFYERRYNSAYSKEKEHSRTHFKNMDRPYGLEDRYDLTDYHGGKNRPDIVLERHQCRPDLKRPSGSVPEIITIDPTLAHSGTTERGWDQKYEYRNAIRSFVDTTSEGKSKQIVKAAWGVSTHLRRGKNDYVEVFSKRRTQYRHGFICLRPEDDYIHALRDTLRRILQYAGWVGG